MRYRQPPSIKTARDLKTMYAVNSQRIATIFCRMVVCADFHSNSRVTLVKKHTIPFHLENEWSQGQFIFLKRELCSRERSEREQNKASLHHKAFFTHIQKSRNGEYTLRSGIFVF